MRADTHALNRAITLSLLLALVTTGLDAHAPAASAAVRARRVFTCRAAEPACWPVSFDFTPDGKRLFYVEKLTGQVRVRSLRNGSDKLWTTISNLETEGFEQGLLGLVLDQGWNQGPERHWVYVYYTRDQSPDADANVIARLRKEGGSLVADELLVIPGAAVNHNGGVIEFGPDRRLYAVTGDGKVQARSQEEMDPAGKVLRINRDGSIPSDNPFPGSLAFSFGHRNSFGFTFDPRTGRLWQTENGPECNDEVNLVLRGGNYAWGPAAACGSAPPPVDTNQDGPEPRRLPEKLYRDTIAITGATFCDQCGLGRNGDLLVGAHSDGKIRAFELTRRRGGIRRQTALYEHIRGIHGLETGPGHRVFFSDLTGVFRLVRT